MKAFFGTLIFVVFILCSDATPLAREPTKINNLPIEVLLIIYEQLGLDSLMNVARSHPYNRAVASIVFNRKYAIKTLKFDRDRFYSKSLYEQNTDISYMMNILDSFGHLLSSLKVDYSYFNNKQTAQFNRIVSRTQFNSLIDIELRDCDNRKLKAFLKPLSKVEVVHLHGDVKTDKIGLGKLFPAATSININNVLYVDGALVNNEPPQAEQVQEFTGPFGFVRKFFNSFSK